MLERENLTYNMMLTYMVLRGVGITYTNLTYSVMAKYIMVGGQGMIYVK